MIRLARRRLTIPRGDSGFFYVPVIINKENIIAIFSIFNDYQNIWTHECLIENGMITVQFEEDDTKNFPLGKYNWDIKIYVNPQYNDNGLLINGDEVHSYYAGFTYPVCEITLSRERG